MQARVTLENLTVSYARHPAVHHASGSFAAGSLTAIAGPNGAGKTTLIKAIAGIIQAGEGDIRIEGAKQESIAYLPQATALERDFPMSVLHLVATGFWHKTGGWRAITPQMKAQASQALEAVGLAGFEKRELTNLSAGQFQRALFARILVQDASLILLDEPFNAIDTATTERLIEIIRHWHEEGRTVIAALHDLEQIRRHFPECLLLARECIAWGPTAEVLEQANLLKARFFQENWKDAAPLCERAS